MQKNYELLYIVHPDLEGSTEKVTEKVTGFIKKADGEITSQEDWGKRKLAYTMAKNDFGVYVLVNFSVESTKLHLVERDLRLSEEILRSMIVVVPDVKEIVLKPRKESNAAEAPLDKKAEAPASIIVAEEKPVKKVVKKAAPKKSVSSLSEAKDPEILHEIQNDKKKKAAPTRSTGSGSAKKAAKTAEVDEAERLKKLDEKLDELLK